MAKGTVAPAGVLSTLRGAVVVITFPEAVNKTAWIQISCCFVSPFLIFPSTSKVVPETILAVGAPTMVISFITAATAAVAVAELSVGVLRVEALPDPLSVLQAASPKAKRRRKQMGKNIVF